MIESRWGDLLIPDPSPMLVEALRRMVLGPVSLRNVLPDFPGYDSEWGRCSLASRELHRELTDIQYLVDRTLSVGATPLLTVAPLSPRARFLPGPLPRGTGTPRVVLSPFARLRYTENGTYLESPYSDHRVELHRPEAAWLIGGLADGSDGAHLGDLRTVARLTALALPDTVAAAGAAYLLAAGMASLNESGRSESE